MLLIKTHTRFKQSREESPSTNGPKMWTLFAKMPKYGLLNNKQIFAFLSYSEHSGTTSSALNACLGHKNTLGNQIQINSLKKQYAFLKIILLILLP